MKLKNKKTGKIIKLDIHCIAGKVYESLAEINEEWEDYEEPKDYWWISPVDTDVVHCVEDVKDEMDQYNKEIGNYFETKEEAERAMEKLKAWKRLKDKGFRFDNFVRNAIYYKLSDKEIEKDDVLEDLDLLFGGEE